MTDEYDVEGKTPEELKEKVTDLRLELIENLLKNLIKELILLRTSVNEHAPILIHLLSSIETNTYTRDAN